MGCSGGGNTNRRGVGSCRGGGGNPGRFGCCNVGILEGGSWGILIVGSCVGVVVVVVVVAGWLTWRWMRMKRRRRWKLCGLVLGVRPHRYGSRGGGNWRWWVGVVVGRCYGRRSGR